MREGDLKRDKINRKRSILGSRSRLNAKSRITYSSNATAYVQYIIVNL